MAAVRMLVKLSGTRDGADWPNPGEVLVCPEEEASSLIATCLAVAVAVEAKVERAVVAPEPEAAVIKRGPGRPRKPVD